MTRQLPQATVRAFLMGNSGSGKTTLAHRLYLSRAPRVLILDLTGEWSERVDAVALSVPEAVAAIQRLAPSGKWRVSLALSPDELPALVEWLVPVPQLQKSPVLAMHGAFLLVDEVDLLAPQGTASLPIRTLYRRSRHVGLSIVSTTQRPANVSREVSAQSTHAVALAMSEPRDRLYCGDLMRWTPAELARLEAWTRRHPHGAVWKDLRVGTLLWIDEKGKVSAKGLRPSRADAFDAEGEA